MRAYDLATQTPWAITPDALRQLWRIAARLDGSADLAAELRAARAARPASVAMRMSRPLDGAPSATVRDGVAIVPVIGPIVRHADMLSDVSGLTSLSAIAADIGAAMDAPSVHTLLLWLDSPGGEATGIADVAEQLYRARGAKRIESYAETACSAAYWLASACARITAEPNALLGSVGTVIAIDDPEKRPTKEITIVSSYAPNKRPDVQTEAGRARYLQLVDQMTETFIAAVARNRGLTEDQVITDFEQGGVLVGRYAVAAGMADRLGTFEATMAELAAPPRPSPSAPAGERGAFTAHMRRVFRETL